MQKTKNIFMRGISLLLVIVSIISTPVYAIEPNGTSGANSNNQDSSVGPSSTNDAQATLKEEGEAFNDLWQGLRVYVVDEQGNLVVNKNGELVVDYLYNPSLMTQANFSKDFNRYYSATKVHYTGTEYAPGAGERTCITRVGNNTAPVVSKSITEMELGFRATADTKIMIGHYPTLCYHSLNGKRSNGYTGVRPHFEDDRQYGRDVDHDGNLDMGMKCLIYDMYPNQAQTFYEDGYTLCVEHIFAIKLYKNSNSLSGKVFYGSVYEFGLYCQAKNVVKAGYVWDYALRFIPKSLILDYTPNVEDDGEHCLKNVANLGVPNPEVVGNDRARVSVNELVRDGYGINLYHKELDNPQTEVTPEDPDEPVEPTSQEEIVQVFTLDEGNIDSIDAYTGYRAQEGKYDISTSYGIPTTEYLSNVIYAQDRVVELAFGSEAWVPKEFPVVKYNLYYKEPYEYEYEKTCTCNLYDKNGKYVGCTTDHTKTETRYHTGYVTGQSAPIIRVGQYFYVSDYAVYGLESVQVQNTAASAYYTSEMTDLKKSDIKIMASGVEEPGTISGTDVNKHINFEDVTKWNGHVAGNSEIGHGDFSSKAAAEEWIRSNATSWAEEHVGYPKVKNDYVEIDGVVYLDDKEVTGKENAKSMTNGK